MTSKTYLSAKILDDRIKVDINGPRSEVMALFEEEAVMLFNSFKENGCPDTMGVFCRFVKNVTKEVFDIDL